MYACTVVGQVGEERTVLATTTAKRRFSRTQPCPLLGQTKKFKVNQLLCQENTDIRALTIVHGVNKPADSHTELLSLK